MNYTETINNHCAEIKNNLLTKHLRYMADTGKKMLLISETYNGVWLEHVYDSVIFAELYPEYLSVAVNTMEMFCRCQQTSGQIPMSLSSRDNRLFCGLCQIQEVVSFAKICMMVYKKTKDRNFLKTVYKTNVEWDAWLRKCRMTTDRGLVEMFVGFDTGHDNSGRLQGMSCPKNNGKNGAEVKPPEDGITPILAVDINSNFYATEVALSEMAKELGLDGESEKWKNSAKKIKDKIFEYCFDENDCYFYDVDKNNHKRKYKSCSIFHLFICGVLDKEADKDLIEKITVRYIKNPNEFWTKYPFPSMSVSDPSFKKHTQSNCWGYFSQALIALRCTLWMDNYGLNKEFNELCEKWLKAWTENYDTVKFGQEIDPFSGKPSECSEWYSSCMLFYIYAARRLGYDLNSKNE